MSEYVQKAYDEGYKQATLEFYPDLVSANMMVGELESVVEGKEAVIFQNEREINKLKQTVYNYELAMKIGIPTVIVVVAGLTIFAILK